MSTFAPTSYEEAVLTHKPLRRGRTAQTGNAPPRRLNASSSVPYALNSVALRKKAKAKNKRGKVPKTKGVQTKFNTMVKERAHWICVRCHRDYSENRRLLQCSHFWGVGFTSTRFDFDNCDALCYPCHYGQLHTGWEYNKQGEYRLFMIEKLGQEGYDALEQKARQRMKLSDAKEEFLANANTSQEGGCR